MRRLLQRREDVARGLLLFSSDLRLPHGPGHEICGRVLESSERGADELRARHRLPSCGDPGAVRPGSTTAVGGVGIHALQIAAAEGATAVRPDVSERALEVAAGVGADRELRK